MTSRELLLNGLKEIGITPAELQVDVFLRYMDEIKRWRKVYSLTSLKDDTDIIINHFLDSLLYLNALPKTAIDIADIGSGAGFPGIPLKIIMPELRISLIEPSRKKAAFLRYVIRTLGLLNIEVIEKQVESIKDMKFDAVLTRALFKVNEFINKAGRLVQDGGVLIVSKGQGVADELKNIEDVKVITLKLPLTDIERNLVIIGK